MALSKSQLTYGLYLGGGFSAVAEARFSLYSPRPRNDKRKPCSVAFRCFKKYKGSQAAVGSASYTEAVESESYNTTVGSELYTKTAGSESYTSSRTPRRFLTHPQFFRNTLCPWRPYPPSAPSCVYAPSQLRQHVPWCFCRHRPSG